MILRDYQKKSVDEILSGIANGRMRQMLALPTGAGKTLIASALIKHYSDQSKTALFVVERVTLITQAVRAFNRLGLEIGILQGENTKRGLRDEVTVASIQTIRSRGKSPFADLIIIDEAHILHKTHLDMLSAWPNTPVVGLSATPLRPDLGKYFSHLVRGPTVKDLTDQKYLVPVTAYCPSSEKMQKILEGVGVKGGDFSEKDLSEAINRKELVGDIVSTWMSKGNGQPTLCFAIDIAHSKSIVADFCAVGVKAEHIDCHTPDSDRKRIYDRFESGDVEVLSSVNVLGIGFDAPHAACGILARPTLSEALDMQQKGRLLRPSNGKESALILDHAGNTLRFGLPVDFEVPSLNHGKHETAKEKRKKQKMVACKACGFVLDPGQFKCPACGVERPRRASNVSYLDGSLVDYSGSRKEKNADVDQRNWYCCFLWYVAQRNYKITYAYHMYLEKFNGLKPPWSWQQLPPKVPTEEQRRWLTSYEIKKRAEWKKQQGIAT